LSQSEEGGKFMILASIRMTIPRKKRDEALKVLELIVGQNKVYSGCLGSHIYEDALENNIIVFEEKWRNEEDLERHLSSGEYRTVLLVMEMALKQPEVKFYRISTSTGMETIEKARSSTR
jgi:quinol monooxygenase YgiN